MDEKAQKLIERMANLFDEDITDMDQLDAADFKDNADTIWTMVEDARELLK